MDLGMWYSWQYNPVMAFWFYFSVVAELVQILALLFILHYLTKPKEEK